MLLVNATYKAHWDLPGGMAEANEPPRTAAARELREELDVSVQIGRLLLVNSVGPNDPWDDQLVFVFDGGTLDDQHAGQLTLSDLEISAYRFVIPDDAVDLLRPDVHQRLHRALTQDVEPQPARRGGVGAAPSWPSVDGSPGSRRRGRPSAPG